jgi:hypothetical protein
VIRLHGDGAPLANFADAPDSWSASRRLLSVCVGLRVKYLVCSDIADHAWTLVCEAGKCQGLAYIQYFCPVDFVSKKWILCGFGRCPISWSQRLIPTEDQSGISKSRQVLQHAPLPGYPSRNAEYPLDCEAQGDKVVCSDVYSANQSLETRDGPEMVKYIYISIGSFLA